MPPTNLFGLGYGVGPAGYGYPSVGRWSPLSLGTSLAAWYKADAGCYTDAACLFASASSQYLSKTSPTFAPTTKMTIAFDYKPTAIGVTQDLVALWQPVGDQRSFIVRLGSGGRVSIIMSSNGVDSANEYETTDVLTAGVNSRVVLVYDGTLAAANRVAIYADGAQMAGAVASGTIPASVFASTGSLVVGRVGDVGANYANGALARLGFSSLALSGAALTAAHTSTFWADMTAARQADWFSFYNLCEASSTRVDSTGLNNLTPTNGPTVAAGPGEGACVDNSPVKRWESRVGSLHLTQSDITKQPLWIASAQNGLPAVRDDGVDDVFASFAHGAASTLAAVFSAKAAGSGSDGALSFVGGSSTHYIGDFGGGPSWGYFPADGAAVKSLGAGDPSSWQSILWSYESTSVVRASVSSQAETTCDPDATLGSGAIVFGGNATDPIDGDLGELFLIADSVPALAVRNSARAYLKSRWGTP